ncbi:MAG: hypothetical protein RL440_639, partial [Bacteroidota bacterium]
MFNKTASYKFWIKKKPHITVRLLKSASTYSPTIK